MHQTNCWIHRKLCSTNDQHISLSDISRSFFKQVLIQFFAVQNCIGFDDPVTYFASRYAFCFQDGRYFIGFITSHAVAVHGIAVRFYHFFTSCSLVQAIDILRNYSTKFSLFLPFSQFQVRSIRLYVIAHDPLITARASAV